MPIMWLRRGFILLQSRKHPKLKIYEASYAMKYLRHKFLAQGEALLERILKQCVSQGFRQRFQIYNRCFNKNMDNLNLINH